MYSEDIQGFALSPQQQRIWKLQEAGDSDRGLRCEGTVEITGLLDLETLRRALRGTVERYEIWRTFFHQLPGVEYPVQVVAAAAAPELEVHDLAGLDPAGQEVEAGRILDAASRWDLDLRCGRPLRVAVLRLSPSRHRLRIVLPSLCADRHSLDILMVETARQYAAVENPQAAPEEILQYADIAAWQNELVVSEQGERGMAHWAGLDLRDWSSAALPFEKEAPEGEAFDPRSTWLELTPDTVPRAQALAQATGGSFGDVLLACWAAFLWRLTGHDNLALGVAFDGRRHEELRHAPGPLARYLPIRVTIAEGLTLRDLVSRLGEETGRAGGLQETFSWDVLPPPHPETIPFCFDLEPSAAACTANGLRFLSRDSRAELGRFRLCLRCQVGDGLLAAALEFDAAALHAADVRRMARLLATLMKNALAEPATPVDGWEILDEQERQRILVEHNRRVAGDLGTGGAACLHRLIEEQAERWPWRVAVAHGEQALTYRELCRRADRLAALLRERGSGPGVLVALCLDRSPDLLVAIVAVLKADGAYVPLDPTYPRERLDLMHADSRAPLLLTSKRLADLIPERPGVERILMDADHLGSDVAAAPGRVTPDDPAYVIYTSGSTGAPKGVVVTHRNVVISTQVRNAYYQDPGPSFLLLSSHAFDSSVAGIFGTLTQGATLILPPEEVQIEPAALAALISQRRIASLLALPSLYALLLEQADPDALISLKTVIVAGEACPAELVRHHRSMLPATALHNEYGPTEGTVWCSVFDCREPVNGSRVPIGFPIAGTRIYLLDRRLRVAPAGVAAELCLGGCGLTRGYLRRRSPTASRFVPDPFGGEWGARLYRTGDLARYASDGSLQFLGRIDQQVKIRGYRIEPGEIESALNELEAIRESVVMAREDDHGGLRLVAYVAPRGSQELTLESLRDALEARLPPYMVPAAFVPLASLPLTPNGKVDRQALPAPGLSQLRSRGVYVAPRSPVEERLAGIWAEVLKVDRIGIHDHFLSLGGDSIQAIRMASVAKRCGFPFTPRQLFQYPTLAQLATLLADPASENAAAVEGPVPLTPNQHRFFELPASADLRAGDQAVCLESRERLDPSLVARALQKLVSRHDALRLRFERDASGWRQRLDSPAAVPLTRVDLSSLAPERGAAGEAAAAAARFVPAPVGGSLLRAVLFEPEDGEPSRLVIALHRLIADGVSWRLLLSDLVAVYRGLEAGEELAPPAAASTFKRWAERLSEYAQEGAVVEEGAYWLDDGWPASSALPLLAGGDGAGATEAVEVLLSREESRVLLREVPAIYRARPYEILLSALARILTSRSGSPIVIEVERHDRESLFEGLDVAQTVGPLSIAFPLALDLAGASWPEGALVAVKEQVRRLPRRGLAYGALRYLGEEAVRERLRSLPSPEIGFSFLDLDEVGGSGWDPSPWRIVAGPSSPALAARPTCERLRLDAAAVGGRLHLTWSCREDACSRPLLEALAHELTAELEALVAHARWPGARADVPSDFPLAQIDDDELSRLSSALEEIDHTELGSTC